MHLGEDLLGERLGHLEEVGGAAGLFDALLLSIGQLLDVAVHGVLFASNTIVSLLRIVGGRENGVG